MYEFIINSQYFNSKCNCDKKVLFTFYGNRWRFYMIQCNKNARRSEKESRLSSTCENSGAHSEFLFPDKYHKLDGIKVTFTVSLSDTNPVSFSFLVSWTSRLTENENIIKLLKLWTQLTSAVVEKYTWIYSLQISFKITCSLSDIIRNIMFLKLNCFGLNLTLILILW